MERIGERLKRLRDENGLSVIELASAVGCSEATIRQLENGQVKAPTFILGLRIADRLAVDPRYLALGDGASMTERFDVLERRLAMLERSLARRETERRR